MSFTFSPFSFTNVSINGLKHKSPATVSAATTSGEPINVCVFGFPSARFAKLRLKEVIIELGRSGLSVSRFHCPMQGPHALAITMPPTDSNSAKTPSRSAVNLTCSDPGLIIN